jgi:polyhydroxybutyrate depolymerase
MRRLLGIVLAAVLVSAACGSGRDETRTVLNSTGTDTGRIVAHVPQHATTTGVVVLHSFAHLDGEPVAQGWSSASDHYGFVALYPARDGSWNAGLCCGPAAASARDDVGWLAAAISDARKRYRLTTIYLTGFSNGAMMVERLVAERPAVATRFAVWGGAPEMPESGRWLGKGALYSGALDTQVPIRGGTVLVGGQPTLIRPATASGTWLLGAHLQQIVVPGVGHTPPAGWPELAWRALSAPPGLAPVR